MRRAGILTAVAAAVLAVPVALVGQAHAAGSNPNEIVDTTPTAEQLVAALVGPGVSVSNVTYTAGAGALGTFNFADPTVVGFDQGIVMSSGSAADVVGPNTADDITTYFALPGDADLSGLAGKETFDAAVIEFDFEPTANQVVFQYTFASDEYSEWANTDFNDVFAFFVNGVNYATVRQVAGDSTAPFVPVAVNNINVGNPRGEGWDPTPHRPDLFRENSFSTPPAVPIDLELDGITDVLTFQAPVRPGDPTNHMKLAVADASDGVLDTAVFLQAGSVVSNENPVADLSVTPETGAAPLDVTAIVEGEDPNGLPLTYSIDWGDYSTPSTGDLDQPVGESEKTATTAHTYAFGGTYLVTLTVSNGPLSGTSVEDVEVTGNPATAPEIQTQPTDHAVQPDASFSFNASATGDPTPTVRWQVLTPGGSTYADIAGATSTTYTGTATLTDDGNLYQAVFTNPAGEATTGAALLTVDGTSPTLDPTFSTPPPFVRGTTGVTASPNATDGKSGIASESCDPVDTSTVGSKTLWCRATDNAGNVAQVSVPYLVNFDVTVTSPTAGQQFRRTASIPVVIEVRDATGLISDTEAAGLRSSISVAFTGRTAVTPSYDKRRNQFTVALKTGKPTAGAYSVVVTIVVGGTTLNAVTIPVTIG